MGRGAAGAKEGGGRALPELIQEGWADERKARKWSSRASEREVVRRWRTSGINKEGGSRELKRSSRSTVRPGLHVLAPWTINDHRNEVVLRPR